MAIKNRPTIGSRFPTPSGGAVVGGAVVGVANSPYSSA